MKSKCVWRDKLVSVKDHTLYLHVLRQNDHQMDLSLAAAISVPCQLVLHSMDTVLDCALGVLAPFLLVSRRGTPNYELLECSFADRQLKPRYAFDLLQWSPSFRLLNGPMLVVAGESSEIKIFQCKQAPLSIDLAELLNKTVTIKRYWAFNWEDGHILVMAYLTSCGDSHWTSILVEEQCGRVTRSVEHVPFEYGRIAVCIDSCECASVSPVSGELEKHKRFVVGTSFKQVLVFERGALLCYVCLSVLPANMLVLESSTESVTLAVLCSEGTCTAYQLSETTNKECGYWDDVSDILVGDFAGLGHKQLLIMKHNDTQKKTILTDLNLFSTEESVMDMSQATRESSTNSLSDTVKAFQHRKHEGAVQLTELESELQRKSLLIHSSLTLMNSLGGCGGVGTPACDPDMLCIIPGNVAGKSGPSPDTRSLNPVKVEHLWKRMECGQWIIGMVLRNVSNDSLSDICSSALSPHEDTPTQSSSSIVWREHLAGPASAEEQLLTQITSPAKRRKLKDVLSTEWRSGESASLEPSQSLCSVSTLSLPTSSCSRDGRVVEVTVVVCGRSEGGGEWTMNIPVSFPLDEALSQEFKVQQSCLRWWKGGGLMREVRWADREQRDLATLLGTRKLTQITMTTQWTDWSELVSILRRRLYLSGSYAVKLVSPTAPPPLDSPTHSLGSEALDGVAVCVCPATPSAGHMTVMCRCDSQLSLLLATMKQALPVDITLTVQR